MLPQNDNVGGLLRVVGEPDQGPGLFAGVDDVLTAKGVSECLHCDVQTVRREIARGRLGCFHVGRSVRITRLQLLQYVNGVEAEKGAAAK